VDAILARSADAVHEAARSHGSASRVFVGVFAQTAGASRKREWWAVPALHDSRD
jgi:hypothetical protein